MSLAIGMDVGGSKIGAVVTDHTGAVLDRWQEPSPARTEAFLPAIGAIVRRLRERHEVTAIGLGVGGFIDRERATVLFAKNIGWVGEPIKAWLEAELRLPVAIENDANAAAWGEARFGAGTGESSLVCLTLGTGLGGGIIVDGRLLRGQRGVAAECGHLLVMPGGIPCGCGGDGCWEMYCSGTALVREAKALAAAGSPLTEALLARAEGRPEAISGGMITAMAEAGDPGAIELLRRIGWWLGRGMASLAALLDPGCFVIGGSVAAAGELLLEPARRSFLDHLPARGHREAASIVAAALGNDAGAIGAADLARSSSLPMRADAQGYAMSQ